MNSVFNVLQVIGILLLLALLGLLLRGHLPRWIILFCYAAAQAIITSFDIWGRYGEGGRESAFYNDLYWTGEIVWDVLAFVLVAALILRAMAGQPALDGAKKILAIVGGAMVVLPFVLSTKKPFSPAWFNSASQILNFGASILNLVLWGALIAFRKRDRLLMMVSAGLGINVAGAAIAWGVRQLGEKTPWPKPIRDTADLFAAVTYLAGIALWCYAFRNKAEETPPPAAPVASPS